MAENKEQDVKMMTVYLFDQNGVHRLIGTTEIPEGNALSAGQTQVEPIEKSENYWNGQAWTSELIQVYCYDPNKNNEFTQIKMVPQGSLLGPNETFTKPEDGLYQPMHFNGTKWVGVTREEYIKAHPAPKVEPSAQTQAVNLLGQQLITLKADNANDLKTVNSKIDKLTDSLNLVGQMIAKQQMAQPQGGTN